MPVREQNLSPEYKSCFLKDNKGWDSFIVVSEEAGLLGFASLSQIGDDWLEVSRTVARPGFGRLLYQNLAKYAAYRDLHLVSDREGDTRDGALQHWCDFFENINPANKARIPDHLNEYVCEDLTEEEAEPFCLGYRLPADESFLKSLIDIKTSSKIKEYYQFVEKGNDWFIASYERDGNRWIDVEEPIPEGIRSSLSYPMLIEARISDLCIDGEIMRSCIEGVKKGDRSFSQGEPVSCAIDIEGDCVLFDGHHRIAEAILAGKEVVQIQIEADERRHGRQEDLERPDKSDLFELNEFFRRESKKATSLEAGPY